MRNDSELIVIVGKQQEKDINATFKKRSVPFA